LEQGIECCAPILGEGMGWDRQIDLLSNEDIQFGDSGLETFELWQVRVEIEGINTSQQVKTIEFAFGLDRSRGSIALRSGMQPEAVLHAYAEPCQKRASESAEALLGRNRLISMVQEVHYLPFQSLVMWQIGYVTDVVVGTDEDKMVWVREELANSLHFSAARILAGAKRVEADDDERIGCIEKSRIEFGLSAIVGHPLDLDDRMTGLRAGLFHKRGEVLPHDMIQEAADALVKASRVRKRFKSRVEHPSALKERRKPVFDNFEWRADLSGSAPCVINHYFSTSH
jgi:hypothetical protein